jgi:hypothetical protein
MRPTGSREDDRYGVASPSDRDPVRSHSILTGAGTLPLTLRLPRRVLPVVAWLLLAASAPAAAAPPACERTPLASAALRDDDGFITMPVAVAGRVASMLVDTGSDTGLLTEQGAAGLGLQRDQSRRTTLQGTVRPVPNGSVPVGTLPAMPFITPPVAGLIGADVLARFDVEMDLPHRRIVFWRVALGSVACAPPPAWSGAYDAVPLAISGGRAMLSATLDGHPITALLDSGARSRIVSTRAAARVGVGADQLGADPGGINAGIDLHDSTYHWHRFHTLAIGHETFDNPVLTVAPVAERVDLLLGADWFATRDVWISYATATLFVRR